MANPEQGPTEQGVLGNWQTISFEVPDFLEPAREAIDAFFNFLIQILNILLAVLEILKVFATGLLDPVIAIIQAILSLIEDLLNDLRQAGVYAHGDWYFMEGPDFAALRGGYFGYEGRMVGRLTDTSDPNRPDISSRSTCLAVFLYVGTDIRGVNRIVQLIRSILSLFNRQYPVPRMQNQVTNVRATYGHDGATIFSFNKGFFKAFMPRRTVDDNINNPFNAVNLTWQMAPIPGKPFPDTPVIPPAGFLVEFSTLRVPLPLVIERPIEGTLEVGTGAGGSPTPKREVVDALDDEGNPIFLTSGADQIDVRGAINYNDAVTFLGEQKPDAARIYAFKSLADPSPIPLNDLQSGSKHYIQKAFYVPFSQNLFFPGKGFGATFLFDDMPFAAEWELDNGRAERINDDGQPEQFFVRVRAINRDVKSPTDWQQIADQTALRDHDGPVLPMKDPQEIQLNDRGPASDVLEVLFPDASTELYLRALAEALAVMVLSRSDVSILRGASGPIDYPPSGPGDALPDGTLAPFWSQYEDRARLTTQLEDIAKFMMPQVVGRRQVKKYFTQEGVSPAKFRKKLFINIINLTNRMFTKNTPPLAARQLAVERAEPLLNFRAVFISTGNPSLGSIETLIDPDLPDDVQGGSLMELLQDTDSTFGIAPNPYALGIVDSRAASRIKVNVASQTTLPRSPHFFFAGSTADEDRGRGSVDAAPVFYERNGGRLLDVEFIRNTIPDEVYEAAQFVLQTAVGPQVRDGDGGWIAFRLFPQGLPAIDRFFDQILALLRSIQAAIASIAETIVRYIEYLQSRIIELQAFLNRINALIQRLLRFFFSIVPAAGLVLVAPGTDGVITGLLGADNKPIEPANPQADSYGGGVVLVAGGIPNIALDVFRAFFKGDS